MGSKNTVIMSINIPTFHSLRHFSFTEVEPLINPFYIRPQWRHIQKALMLISDLLDQLLSAWGAVQFTFTQHVLQLESTGFALLQFSVQSRAENLAVLTNFSSYTVAVHVCNNLIFSTDTSMLYLLSQCKNTLGGKKTSGYEYLCK